MKEDEKLNKTVGSVFQKNVFKVVFAAKTKLCNVVFLPRHYVLGGKPGKLLGSSASWISNAGQPMRIETCTSQVTRYLLCWKIWSLDHVCRSANGSRDLNRPEYRVFAALEQMEFGSVMLVSQ